MLKQRIAREREKGGNPARYYRRQYIQATKLPVPAGFDIHHLDHNWKNNKVSNLVALPKALHDRWHRLEARGLVTYCRGRFYMAANVLEPTGNKLLRDLKQCVDEISAWLNYRDYLLGTIGLNLHNLSYEPANA